MHRLISPAKKFLLSLGSLLLIFSLFGILYLLGPLLQAEIHYQFKEKDVTSPETPLNVQVPDPAFSLIIPKIKAAAKVIANVDANNVKEYWPILKKGVAHAKGTVFPRMIGTIYLFAHSTDAPWNVARYNAVFYLLNKLETGDEIIVFFNNKRFNYQVTEKKIVNRTQTDFFNQRETELLVLQTCYPPGTTQKALLILAKPIITID